MSILDRYILKRFAANFAILFALLFVFATAVDLILNLDRFVDVAQTAAGEDAGSWSVAAVLIALVADFQAPRIFQFYAYLHGMVAVAAMGFTLAQMHRHRELVAIMASGVSLHRVAMPFIIAVFALSVIQLLNQELMLPRVAPLLLRDYRQMGEHGVESFEVRFTPDGRGNLLLAARFQPQQNRLLWPVFLERDARGLTVRRVWASQADWVEADRSWDLVDGKSVRAVGGSPPGPTEPPATAPAAQTPGTASRDLSFIAEVIDRYPSDLTPQVLLVRRYNQFASMLSLAQIGEILEAPRTGAADSGSSPIAASADRDTLLRYRYSRFSSVLVNLLVIGLTLPFFLLREPANLLRQSVLCASVAIPAAVGSAIGMMIEMPGISPALSVFLPVIVLVFVSMFPWTFFKT